MALIHLQMNCPPKRTRDYKKSKRLGAVLLPSCAESCQSPEWCQDFGYTPIVKRHFEIRKKHIVL